MTFPDAIPTGILPWRKLYGMLSRKNRQKSVNGHYLFDKAIREESNML